ncbi:hypothetical protein CKM354_000140000 [Cercospora kikuchii]|uniref:C2H2-type domain-containing protein n=1 Tax=Cercospora kikuchii TaxID=84275 RepID=A0A9P3C7Y9_9PEZI|nr:uncharacterized protein CKM354_000140000 [Cercospora kikuchii]GIZ37973.1 hypothetical protein CKM354_000140000 [Cercospora kikuchii]
MYGCATCTREFGSVHAAAQHMNAVNHCAECETCDEQFYNQRACNQHMNDCDHWAPRYDCEACNLQFDSSSAARRHMDNNNHWRQHYCRECQRGFQNENNLQQHLRGAAHMANSITCPFCKRGHTTASGVAHHLETGACPAARNLNRETIYKIINERDTRGAITNKQLTWHEEENAELVASNASWNGYAFECYLCHRDFGTLRALNQHLSSPAHKQKIYHCLSRSCGRQFTALAQLFNHPESESCGATRFSVVQKNAAAVFFGQRMIGW